MKKQIKAMLEYCGIVTVVVLLWTFAEALLLGENTHSKIDSIVAAILSGLIYDKINQ